MAIIGNIPNIFRQTHIGFHDMWHAAAALQEELTLEDANHRQLGRALVERAEPAQGRWPMHGPGWFHSRECRMIYIYIYYVYIC